MGSVVRLYTRLHAMNDHHPPRFYFSLPRLLALLRHGDTRRAELNGVEAWAGNVAIFVVWYLFFAQFVPGRLAWWLAALALVALAVLVFLFWLLALHLNSLILELLRRFGLLRSLPARRGQAVLISAATTAMALQLVQGGALSGEIGAIWLVAVAMNLGAAIILVLRDGNAVHS
jgi:hypothetical protein